MNSSCLTQMDLGKWFRHIEYIVGILNSISDKERAIALNKSLLRSCYVFLNMATTYVDQTDSDDVDVMICRIKTIIINLQQKMSSNHLLKIQENAYEQITFYELEKWKQHIMYMVGVMMATSKEYHNRYRVKIRNDIKILFVYGLAYLNKLDEEERKANDIQALLLQIINIYNNIKQ